MTADWPEYQHLTPAQLAEFDQTTAHMQTTVDVIIDTYIVARTSQYDRNEVFIALAQSVEKKCETINTACQYLALMTDRVAQLLAENATLKTQLDNAYMNGHTGMPEPR